MNLLPSFTTPYIEVIQHAHNNSIALHALRLDVVHPLISGNKWYKLRLYLQEAAQQQKKTILTYGGPYSNHLLATAAACAAFGFKSSAIVRGEEPKILSPTLQQAKGLGMKLYFVSRENYKTKTIPEAVFQRTAEKNLYIINEGGYGLMGAIGAGTLLQETDTKNYHYLVAACGTGTTLAGLVLEAHPHQQAVGISVLKNQMSLKREIEALVPERKSHFHVLHGYHFGGYAKQNPALFQWMNEWFLRTGIPTDFVYTAKLFYAVEDLLKSGFFPSSSRILVVHSGGLQGNTSLKKGTLIF